MFFWYGSSSGSTLRSQRSKLHSPFFSLYYPSRFISALAIGVGRSIQAPKYHDHGDNGQYGTVDRFDCERQQDRREWAITDGKIGILSLLMQRGGGVKSSSSELPEDGSIFQSLLYGHTIAVIIEEPLPCFVYKELGRADMIVDVHRRLDL
jgi:hypothetical protein